MIEQRVTLRYGAQQIPAIVQAVQGDTGRDVIFELADYEIPAGATANYYIDKPDGNAVYNSAEVISSTEILAHLTEHALAEPGRNNGQVRILSDGEVITSFDFVLEVEAFRGILRLQSETEVNIFDEALQAAAEDAIEEIQAQTPVVTGMQNSIAPTYSASSTYAVGDYVMYNAQLYKCNTAITTAEAWTAAHWTQVPLANDVNDLKRAFIQSPNLINPNELVAGYLSGSNVIANDAFITTGYIEIVNGRTYIIYKDGTDLGGGANNVALYNSAKESIQNATASAVPDHNGWYTITINNANARYARTTSNILGISEFYFGEGSNVLEEIPPYGKKISDYIGIEYKQVKNKPIKESPNLIDPNALVDGYLSGSTVVSNQWFKTTDYIPVVPGKTYICYKDKTDLGGGAGNMPLYNESKESIYNLSATEITGYPGWFVFTVNKPYARYVRTTTHINGAENFYLGEGNAPLGFIPLYGVNYVNDDVFIRQSQIVKDSADYDSFLSGKIWYAIGDSATHGDFSGISQPNIKDGIYAGELPVYPFLIGNRTGAVVHNLAVNGAVLATISDQPTRYQWSAEEHYKLVGEDADIVTIWIGANDMWQNVPIDTIDSTDPTTFYGAYNVVLSWLVNNRPNAKLGLVASFWCTQAYAEATIAIGAKYGIPVLNLYNDPKLPVTVGSQRPDVSADIKTLRNSQWIVSQSNTHPSAKYHEIESYFIEEWLKTL